MKKTNKFLTGWSDVVVPKITALMALCLLMGLTACKDEIKYEPGEIPTNAQVFFSQGVPLRLNLIADMSVTTYDVEVRRVDKTSALTVNISSVNGNPSIFNIPSSVSFAAGSDVSKFTITYDPEELGFDNFVPLTISIDPSVTTPYGNTIWEFTAGIPAPWVSLGMATYTDDFISTFWGISKAPYKVEIQGNEVVPGLFRLVNPYGEAYPFNDPGDWDESKDYYLLIDASDPEGVYLPHPQYMGIDWGYGEMMMTSLAGLRIYRGSSTFEEQKELGFCGTYANGVITFPVNALAIGMTDYNDGAMYAANSNGWFQVVMPGYDIIEYDYSAEITYTGRFTDLDDVDYAVADVTLGEDVAYGVVALAPGGMSQATLTGILDGSIESVKLKTDGTVKMPCAETGTYTYVVLTFDDDSIPQEFEYDTFDFYSSAGGGASLPTIEDFYGDYTLIGYDQWDGTEYEMSVTIEEGDEPNTLIVSGIDYAGDLIATFDPDNAYLLIAPQDIPDFTYNEEDYPSALYTTTEDGDVSDELPMIFARRLDGSLTFAPTCETDGYILGFELGYFDGFYDLEFIPDGTRKAVAKKSSVAIFKQPMAKEKKATQIAERKKNEKRALDINFKVSKPASLKSMDAMPAF